MPEVSYQIPLMQLSGPRLWGRIPGFLTRPLETLNAISATRPPGLIRFTATSSQQIVLVNHPEAIKVVLHSAADEFGRPEAIQALKPFLGEGIFLSEGALWQEQRKVIRQALSGPHLNELIHNFNIELDQFKTHFRSGADMEKQILYFYLRNMIRHQFNPDWSLDESGLIKNLKEVLEEASFRSQKLNWIKSKLTGVPYEPGSSRALRQLHELVQHWLEEPVSQAPSVRGVAQGGTAAEKKDSVGSVYRALAKMDHPQSIRDGIMNFLFAGFDTVASAQTFLLYALAQSPDCQKKIRDEAHFDSSSAADVRKLQYTMAVVQESLRLYPPVWAVHRVVRSPGRLLGTELGKGTYTMVSPWTIQRHPAYWERASEFVPDRFLNGSKPNPYAYIPFGQGKHICLGNQLGLIQLTLFTAWFCRHFSFSMARPAEHPGLHPGIILSTQKGLYLRMEERHV